MQILLYFQQIDKYAQWKNKLKNKTKQKTNNNTKKTQKQKQTKTKTNGQKALRRMQTPPKVLHMALFNCFSPKQQ